MSSGETGRRIQLLPAYRPAGEKAVLARMSAS
jgi:hypothetical protein